MDKKELLEELEETLELVKRLPSGRRFFYNTGIICIELTKEEAIKKLEEEIDRLKSNLNKEVEK